MTGPGQDEDCDSYEAPDLRTKDEILRSIEWNIEWHIRERKKDKEFANKLIKFIENKTGTDLTGDSNRYEIFIEDLVDFLQTNSKGLGVMRKPYGSEAANEKYRKSYGNIK